MNAIELCDGRFRFTPWSQQIPAYCHLRIYETPVFGKVVVLTEMDEKSGAA